MYKPFKSPPEILVARGIVKCKFSCKSHPYVFSDPFFSGYCMANSFVPGQVIQSDQHIISSCDQLIGDGLSMLVNFKVRAFI